MAKPIPVKKKKAAAAPVAKKKSGGMDKKAKARLEEIQAKADTRYAWAKALYDQQPADVQAAVDRMVKIMRNMANPPKFVMDGRTYPVDEAILNSIQRKTHTWFALRLIVACAEWGIRIGNFKAPKGECIRCGKPVKKVKAKKKGKK